MPKTPEICNIMTLSTAHIPQDTREALDSEADQNEIGLIVYNKADFGWFIYVDDDNLKAVDTKTLHENFPDLELCIQYARAHHCKILCLDCDVEPINDGLNVYDE